ncbi:MAG: sulfatase [Mangrovibacterium sp.]
MKKKQLIDYGLGLLLVAGSSGGTAQAEDEEGTKPNVLYIIMDDMNDWAQYLGGNVQAKTPNLDRLAARGVNFSNAYAAVPLCNPSRTSMFTGIQPFVTGVYNNNQVLADSPIANNSLIMPQHFRNNGYFTLAAGKLFHTKPSADVMQRMWDDKQSIDGGYGPFPEGKQLAEKMENKWFAIGEWTGPDTDFPDVRNSNRVIDFLNQKHEQPFFVAMGFYRPHTPWTAPKRYFDLYKLEDIRRPHILEDDLADIPAYAIEQFIGERQIEKQKWLRENGNYWEQMIRAYLACVSFADDRIGMILDALDQSPYADNTWIVLVGDNGFHHGEKERWAKSALWREACHVPLTVVPPRDMKGIAPALCTAAVSSIDIYPTLIDACNLPPIENQLAGNNLMPLMRNPDRQWNKPALSSFLPGNFTVHFNKWNLIQYADGSRELYDVENDENEFTNLAEKPAYKAIVDSLASYVPEKWHPGIKPIPASRKLPARRRNANQHINE